MRFKSSCESVAGLYATKHDEKEIKIDYVIEDDGHDGIIRLSINGASSQGIVLCDKVLTYGSRTYFTCECGSLFSRLYMVPNSTALKCRKCHHLKYEINSFNRNSKHGKLFLAMHFALKATKERETVKRMFINGRYTKAFIRSLRTANKAGWTGYSREARRLLRAMWFT